MERRGFLKSSALAGGLAGLGLGGFRLDGLHGAVEIQGTDSRSLKAIGRPVRVVSIGFYAGREGKPLDSIAGIIDQEGARGADIIILPETWRGLAAETLHGPTVTTLAALAGKHQTYITCPIMRREGGHDFNSVVLLNRQGQVACVYDKIYPWIPEFADSPALVPGEQVPVHHADFGRVGFATCFDINFPEVWQRLADQGAELVIWPSAYSGGKLLQAHATDFHYYVVSCTGRADCVVFDLDGQELLYQQNSPVNVSRITLDLDRCLFCTDSPADSAHGVVLPPTNMERREKLIKEHGNDVVMEKYLEREEWFVLKAKRPGVSARELARSYGLQEDRELIAQCRRMIDKRRGWNFAAKSAQRPDAS